MKTKNWYNKLFVLCSATVMLCGCIQENPDLVNPPLIVETVNVRFMNLAQDEASRTLWFDDKIIATNTAFNSVAPVDKPPFDSVDIEIVKDDGTKTFATIQKFKFGRLSNYIMLALPNLRPRSQYDTGEVHTDTLVYLQSTTLEPADTNQCYVKFLNANPDTSANYSIKIGCPNGENLFSDNQITNVQYLQSTGTQLIYEGKRVISIIKNSKAVADDGNTTTTANVIGIFELDMKRLQQYAIIVNKMDEVYWFDEMQPNIPPMLLLPITERTANVRIINLATQPVSVVSNTIGSLANDLPSHHISQYNSITTCDVMSLDRIYLQAAGQTTDTVFTSFDIYKDYSMLAFDSKQGAASVLVAVPPIDDRVTPKTGTSIVRVINANYDTSNITVAVGAVAADDSVGYVSGIPLAVNLAAGECSSPTYLICKSPVSVSVFASTQPTKYLFSAVLMLENDKEYVITIDQNDGGKIAAIELKDEQKAVTFAEPAGFLQMVNTTAGTLQFALKDNSGNNVINAGQMAIGDIITTFMPLGNNTVTIGSSGTQFNWNTVDVSDRTLLIAANNSNAPDMFAIRGKAMGADVNSFKWRFINAASDVPVLNVYQINQKDTLEQNFGIQYKAASNVNTYFRDKKYSFVFKSENGQELYVANDLLMTNAKNYSIILWGNASNGYKILVIQEY